MSESVLILLINSVVTVVSAICAVFTLWIRANYTHNKTLRSLDDNTIITTKAAAVTIKNAEALGIAGTEEVVEAKQTITNGSKP